MIYRTSAFKFKDTQNLPFSAQTYSKMKFGSRQSSMECAKYCADSFIEFLKTNKIDKQIVVAPSAYQEIPKSSFHIFKPFVNIVNRWLFANNKSPLITTRIRSNHVYNVDYGTLNVNDREKLIGRDSWGFNCNVLDNVHFVILDDLRMTGNLERVLLKQIENSCIPNTTDIHLLYFAENIAVGEIPDNFENHLNHAAIAHSFDLFKLIKLEGKIDWNMRNIKYVLELPESEMLVLLGAIEMLIPNFSQYFYDLVIQSNCITAPKYVSNIKSLTNYINNNGN